MRRRAKAAQKAARSNREQLVPISPEFYDSNKDDDLIASKSVLLPFNTALLASQLIAFIALMVYYSGPAASINESSIQSAYDYGAPDYNCTPMSFHPYWQNTMNYQWCKDEVAAHLPSETTITNFTDEDAKYWTYTPFSFTDLPALTPDVRALQFGAVSASVRTTFAEEMQTIQGCEDPDSMSFMDLETAGSIPMRIEKHPGLRSTEVSMPQSDCQLTNLNNRLGGCVDWTRESVRVGTTGSVINGASILDIVSPESYFYRWNEEFFQFVTADASIQPYVDCVDAQVGFVYGDQVDLRSACESLLSDEALKISTLYSRGSVVERCTNTPQTAKEMFQKLVDADLVCSFAIANGPFNCEATFPLPIEQRFSLAYANSLLLYAVFSTICVKIFFAANSKNESQDGECAEIK